jgi:rod shape-determining protein MreC
MRRPFLGLFRRRDADAFSLPGVSSLIPKRFRPALTAGFLIIVSLVMLSYHVRNPGATGGIRHLVLEAAAPLQGVVNQVFGANNAAWKDYIMLVGLQEENKRLKRDNALLVQELMQYREGYLEGLRLQKLLAMREEIKRHTVAAQVIGRDQASAFKTILINRGTSAGVRAGLPVMGDKGLVGRVMAVSWHAAQVLLIVDGSSNVDALLQSSRTQGILQGSATDLCILKYIPKTQEVKVGEPVLTSGLSGVFPKGWLIGVVSSVYKGDAGLFQRIEVTPAVNFARIEEVLVLLQPGGDGR